MSAPEVLEARRAHVLEQLRTEPSLIVALSGGVDSALLLALAVEALGAGRVVAVTGRSETVTEEEVEDARRVAFERGVPHEVVSTHELENTEYLANRGDRCYHCRTELFRILGAIAKERMPTRVAYGAIVDDLGEDRPGMRAAGEMGIVAPLLDAGLTKSDVRRLAASVGLHVAEKPANACLASRIPTGVPVTRERLSQVARAERAMRALGFPQVRVRHHGDLARIEVPGGDLPRLRAADSAGKIAQAVRPAGFFRHEIDPRGYRPAGSLHSIDPQREGGQ